MPATPTALRRIAAVSGVALSLVVMATPPKGAPDAAPQQPQPNAEIAPAGAPADALPAPTDIISRYVDALGGEAAIRAHTSVHITGIREQITDGQINGFEIFAMAPDRKLMKVTMPNGEVRQGGFDGERTWASDPSRGPQVFGPVNPDNAPNFDFYLELNYSAHFPQMETMGKEDVNGAACYKVKLKSKSGSERFEFFNINTGLKAGEEQIARTRGEPQGTRLIDMWEGWKDIGGVKVCTRRLTIRQDPRQQNLGEVSQILTYETVEFDTLDPSTIAMPPEVKEVAKVMVNPGQPPAGPRPRDLTPDAAKPADAPAKTGAPN